MKASWHRSHKLQGPKAKARRQGALSRLEEQLIFDRAKSVYKFTEHDKKRIALEIVTLKSRI